MKTMLDLPDELMLKVKLRAVAQRRTVKDLIADFLRQGLGVAPATPPASPTVDSMVEIGPDGLPRVRCRVGAPAARLGTKKLLQLEQSALAAEDARRIGLTKIAMR